MDERFKDFVSRWARGRKTQEVSEAEPTRPAEPTEAELDEGARKMSTESLKLSLESANKRWADQEFDDSAANTANGHRLILHMNAWKKELARRGVSLNS